MKRQATKQLEKRETAEPPTKETKGNEDKDNEETKETKEKEDGKMRNQGTSRKGKTGNVQSHRHYSQRHLHIIIYLNICFHTPLTPTARQCIDLIRNDGCKTFCMENNRLQRKQ